MTDLLNGEEKGEVPKHPKHRLTQLYSKYACSLSMIVRVNVVLNRTVVVDSD